MNRKYFNHSFIPEEEHDQDDEIKEEKERKRHISRKGEKERATKKS